MPWNLFVPCSGESECNNYGTFTDRVEQDDQNDELRHLDDKRPEIEVLAGLVLGVADCGVEALERRLDLHAGALERVVLLRQAEDDQIVVGVCVAETAAV